MEPPPAPSSAIFSHTVHRRAFPLTAVSLLSRSRAELEPLASVISSFVDPVVRKRWTVQQACERNEIALLKRLVTHESASAHPRYRSHVFSEALVHAVRHDNRELLECLLGYCPQGSASKGMVEACSLGKVHLMDWIVKNCTNLTWSSKFANAAATAGHLSVLQWLKTNASGGYDPKLLTSALQHAALAGNLTIVKWIIENVDRSEIPAFDQSFALHNAIQGGHLEILKYLHELRFQLVPWLFINMSDHGAGAGNLEMVQWLFDTGYRASTVTAFKAAVEKGHVAIVRWLMERGRDRYDFNQAFIDAAANGRLELVQLFHSRTSIDRYESTLALAAGAGHIGVVQWLFQNARPAAPSMSFLSSEPPPDTREERAVSEAAENGHVEIVQWLHAQIAGRERQPEYSIAGAAENGRLELVQWLVQNSKPGLRYSLDSAAASGNLELLMWLKTNIETFCSERAMDDAACNDHLRVIKWLHEHCAAPCSKAAMSTAAAKNHLRVVKWLHANRTEGCSVSAMNNAKSVEMTEWLHEYTAASCTPHAMNYAVERGDFETLLFLHENRGEGCTIDAAVNAVFQGHDDMFQWLCEHYAISQETTRRLVQKRVPYDEQTVASIIEQDKAQREQTE